MKSFDNLEPYDDLEDWSDNVDLFMDAMANPPCWHFLEPQFTYRKRTDRVAFPLEYSPKVYQPTEQAFYYA